jgi:hypothetical protein
MASCFHTETFLDFSPTTPQHTCVSKPSEKIRTHSLYRVHLGVDYVHHGGIKISVCKIVHGVEVKYIIQIEANSVHQCCEHNKLIYFFRSFSALRRYEE